MPRPLPRLLIALCCAATFSAPALADAYHPASTDLVLPGAAGLNLRSADGTSQMALPFGTPLHTALRYLGEILGRDLEVSLPEDCPAGPVVIVHFPEQIDLVFVEDHLQGWFLAVESRMQTPHGLRIGGELAETEALQRFESSLGAEFQMQGVFGLTSPEDERVTHLWSGTVCLYR